MKSEISSRKCCTFDRRRRDVLLLEMVTPKHMMVKLKGDEADYWTIIDIDGVIQELPLGLDKYLPTKKGKANP